MDQVPVGTTGKIRAVFMDGEIALDSATVTLKHWDATDLVTDGAATLSDDGQSWEYLLAPLDDVDRLTAVWTGVKNTDTYVTTTVVEVVGGFYFGLDELAQMPGIVNSGNRYRDNLAEGRQWVEAAIEQASNTSFVERFREDVVDRVRGERAHSHYRLLGERWITLQDDYPRRLFGVSIDGTPLSSDDIALLALSGGDLAPHFRYWPAPFNTRWSQVKVQYAAGYDTQPTEDLKAAALRQARDYITSTFGDTEITQQICIDDDDTIKAWVDQVRIPST